MRTLYFSIFLSLITFATATAQPDSEIFPDFTFSDLNGTEHHLQSYLDDEKIVVIDVFATWCGNCQNSVPGWEELYNTHGQAGDQSMVLLSFERDPNTDNEIAYIEQYGVESPVITGAEDLIAELWNISYQPRYFVICPDGSFLSELSQPINGNPQPLIDLSVECNVVPTSLLEMDGFGFMLRPLGKNVLAYASNGERMDYKILDLTGSVVRSGSLEGTTGRLDITTLRNGIYLIAVESEGSVKTLRFLKN